MELCPLDRSFENVATKGVTDMTEDNTNAHAPASIDERRALDAEELKLADQARQPQLGQLSNRELSELITRLRTRRNRARDIADRQGREARSKAAPSGATPASGNTGTLNKHDFLNTALSRAMAERDVRSAPDGKDDARSDAASQKELAEKAMEVTKAGETNLSPMMEEGGALHPNDPDASSGKGDLDSTARRTAPSGAFDDVGDLPSRERSRTRY
jgi:hypothetical protein